MPSLYVPPSCFDENNRNNLVILEEVEGKARDSCLALNEQRGSGLDVDHWESHPHSDTLSTKSAQSFFPNNKETLSIPPVVTLDDECLYGSDDEEIDVPPCERDKLDLMYSIKGMCRVLDLILEEARDGLVRRIAISQTSLKAYINNVSPGACTSITKINFKTLDKFLVKPIGVYGSKEEIVRFLKERGVVDDAIAAQLRADANAATHPSLRSGLYILKGPKQPGNVNQIFVVYWPERTAWDDDAAPSVRENRVIFMRYLTKMCDQLVALISPDHAQTIIWNIRRENGDVQGVDQEESDRMFTFKVAQISKEEASLKVRQGFQVVSEKLVAPDKGNDDMKSKAVKPFLLSGETAQGFMTVEHREARLNVKTFNSHPITPIDLGSLLAKDCLRLSELLSDQSLKILLSSGLEKRFPKECARWKFESTMIQTTSGSQAMAEVIGVSKRMKEDSGTLRRSVYEAILDEVMRRYPDFDRKSFPYRAEANEGPVEHFEPLSKFMSNHPEAKDRFANQLAQAFRSPLDDPEYRKSKERLCLFKELVPLLKENETVDGRRVLEASLSGRLERVKQSMKTADQRRSTWEDLYTPQNTEMNTLDKIVKQAAKSADQITDNQLLASIPQLKAEHGKKHPAVMAACDQAKNGASRCLENVATRLLKGILPEMRKIQIEECKQRIEKEHASRAEEDQRKLRVGLIQNLNGMSAQGTYTHILEVREVKAASFDEGAANGSISSRVYHLDGSRGTLEDPTAMCTIHLISLTTHNQRELRLNPSFTPSPRFYFEHSFKMPNSYSIIRAQLLGREKLLFIVVDSAGNPTVFLENIADMGNAIEQGRGWALNREQLGHELLFTYDESKKMLCIIAADKLQLHVFGFEDTRGFQALGSSVSLSSWYAEGTLIQGACFICGSEEVLLVDSQAQARVLSLQTLQFRPIPLDLKQIPYSVSSTPDGSYLLVVQAQGSDLSLMAYRWSSFGTTEGIPLDIPGLNVGNNLVVTSLVDRTAVHLLKLNLPQQTFHSYALEITHKATDFTFKEKGTCTSSSPTISHRCLIDCFSEVWGRFPVVPALDIASSSPSLRSQKTLVFVTDRDYGMYASHFQEMIQSFERTKKPTANTLKAIKVSASPFSFFASEFLRGGPASHPWEVSQYRTGEWIVELMCLIPIHIAVAKENRFIPLKDGVHSTEFETALLGADVNSVMDSLSFGWYESLFQSYMASKPVKVVSSMGERSVGKTFALNHLVNTSFSGSTMDGVWMSVTPTQDALVVALEFEGIHSLDSSVQEDALLLLFNAAISDLNSVHVEVLFRTSSASPCDIPKLFQSLQSASTLMDTKGDPSFFQSTLVITVKDVADLNKDEVVKRFSLELQKFVQDEQEDNFISRLHAGNLSIMPWPFFKSKEFYEPFSAVKRLLDKQMATYHTAGAFVHTMKAVMAKLKANDWGTISQTMASHRVRWISTLLPNALTFGYAEIDPQWEPLKTLDTGLLIDLPGTPHQLCLSGGEIEQFSARERTLFALQTAWEGNKSRQHIPEEEWMADLSNYLDTIVKMRIPRVREWLMQNISRFQPELVSIDELKRSFENAIMDLKRNVQVCKLQCSSCHLLCVRGRVHPGSHDCWTDHTCARECDFCLGNSGDSRRCTMTAGHAGKHICVAKQHLCGKPCKFSGRNGCLDVCAKVIHHTDKEHLCAAPVHTCGKPCGLAGVKLFGGAVYSCPGGCRIPSGITHTRHDCGSRSCPIQCQLCTRLCSNEDHMHSLDPSSIHLCEHEHQCTATCSASGICLIETVPDPIKAKSTGRDETLQYTKYTQVAKRLKCVKSIPPGTTHHMGLHNHILDSKAIHFCETRCESCGYFCHLSFGHLEQEHETHHGPMDGQHWTADGSADGGLEIDGRKIYPDQQGAPMLCNFVCRAMGRHVHIDYCRAPDGATCKGSEGTQHLTKTLHPDPDKPKDFITHSLFWKRSGFKDPYSKEDQRNFAKCDATCKGPEHTALGGSAVAPSYCVLPLFHPPLNPSTMPAGVGYISQDGHKFSCTNPMVMYEAFQSQLRMESGNNQAGVD